MCGYPGHDKRLHIRLPPNFLDMYDLTTERSFNSQATWVIDVFGLCLDMLSIGVLQRFGSFSRFLQTFRTGVIQINTKFGSF